MAADAFRRDLERRREIYENQCEHQCNESASDSGHEKGHPVELSVAIEPDKQAVDCEAP